MAGELAPDDQGVRAGRVTDCCGSQLYNYLDSIAPLGHIRIKRESCLPLDHLLPDYRKVLYCYGHRGATLDREFEFLGSRATHPGVSVSRCDSVERMKFEKPAIHVIWLLTFACLFGRPDKALDKTGVLCVGDLGLKAGDYSTRFLFSVALPAPVDFAWLTSIYIYVVKISAYYSLYS